ncbi:adenylate/guanylate cyclase domain-containing protein [Sporosarcina koreensis]|uniref:adenylate/guanylate cyclase domain-containing protein n=1 Tax=Sporosarcina koreensis TaxID=334735 RepID=UPI00058EA02E|nr:adenylate/guanylate cyclase domain-containing protein [Sporosarcina koreensis]
MGKQLELEQSQIIERPIAEVWDLLADTNRLNRSIGLFPVTFSPFRTEARRLFREAQGKAYGLLDIQWKEHVFEWVKGSYYSIERNYTKGPVDRVIWKVAVEELTSLATRVTLSGLFVYKNGIGKLALKKGIIPQLLKTFEYAREAETDGHIPSGRKSSPANEVLLAEAKDHLYALGIREPLVDSLISTITTADDSEVTHMQPYRWAEEHGVAKEEAVDLFLLASDAGILDYEWNLMCPNCRVSKMQTAHLADVHNAVHCDLCGVDFDVDFDRYIEMRFKVNGALRETVSQVFCLNGPANSPQTAAQFRIGPGTTKTISWTPDKVDLQLRVLKHNFVVPFTHQHIGPYASLHISSDGFLETTVPQADEITIRNSTDEEMILAVETLEWDPYALTARDVTSMQLFRDLLPKEVLAAGMQIGVGKLTIMFTDLKDSTRLYEQAGDAAAYSDVQRHFTELGQIIRKHRGTIVKTIGDSVMAAFSNQIHALQAALDIQSSVDRLNTALRNPVTIKIGLHEGPVIAVNANGVLDYFGRTVNMAARVQQQSIGDDIVMDRQFYSAVAPGLGLHKAEPFTAALRGMSGDTELIRVT